MRGRHFFGRRFWMRGYFPFAGFGNNYFSFGLRGGNPYPFCRHFTWLPRWWWVYGPYTPWGVNFNFQNTNKNQAEEQN